MGRRRRLRRSVKPGASSSSLRRISALTLQPSSCIYLQIRRPQPSSASVQRQEGRILTFRCVIQHALTSADVFLEQCFDLWSLAFPSPIPHTGSFERGMARSTLVPHAPPRNTLRWLIAFSFARTTLVLIANQGYVIPPFIRRTLVDDSTRGVQDGDTLPNSSFLPRSTFHSSIFRTRAPHPFIRQGESRTYVSLSIDTSIEPSYSFPIAKLRAPGFRSSSP